MTPAPRSGQFLRLGMERLSAPVVEFSLNAKRKSPLHPLFSGARRFSCLKKWGTSKCFWIVPYAGRTETFMHKRADCQPRRNSTYTLRYVRNRTICAKPIRLALRATTKWRQVLVFRVCSCRVSGPLSCPAGMSSPSKRGGCVAADETKSQDRTRRADDRLIDVAVGEELRHTSA